MSDLRRVVQAVLSCVRNAVGEVAKEHAADFGDPDQPALIVVSPLAPGSDTIVADVGVNHLGYVLDAPLPYDLLRDDAELRQPASVRRKLYDGARSRLVLDGVHGDLQAYLEVGRRVVSNSDLIIAIWDGRPAGGPGGTGAVVDLARQQGVPVVHLHSEQEGLILLRLPDGQVVEHDLASLCESLEEIVRLVLAPPIRKPQGSAPLEPNEHSHERAREEPVPDLRESYFKEEPPFWPLRYLLGKPYAIVTGLLAIPVWRDEESWGRRLHLPLAPLPQDYVAATRAAWHDDWEKAKVPPEITAQLERKLIPHFAWANQLAVLYAVRYRSVFFWTYVLAFFAVVAALAGHRAEARHAELEQEYATPLMNLNGAACSNLAPNLIQPYCRELGRRMEAAEFAAVWWPRIELLTLLFICVLYVRGQIIGRYHLKWVDYRSLAERIRHLSFLIPLGQTSPAIRVPAAAAHADPSYTWLNWVFRAIVREVGLFDANLDATLRSNADGGRPVERPYLEHCRALLQERILTPQFRYHSRGKGALERLHTRLEAVTVLLFVAALVVSVIHFVPSSGIHLDPDASLVLAVLLPTAGAAVHGFLSQGDFESVAKRSDSTAKRLKTLRDQVAAVRLRSVEERTRDGLIAHENMLLGMHGLGLREAVLRPMKDRLDEKKDPLLASVLPDLQDRVSRWETQVANMSDVELRALLGRRKLRDYPPAASAELGRLAVEAANIMGEELIGWRVDSQTKPLPLA